MKKGICIALTGGIACGKSTVADFWRRWGATVADADELAHELLAPQGAGVPAVLQEFGATMQAPDGGVDRAQLAAVVFADSAARRNGIDGERTPQKRILTVRKTEHNELSWSDQ